MSRTIEYIDLDEVFRLASVGLNQRQIADSLGLSQDTITRRKQDTADFAAALTKGQAEGIGKVASALFDQAVGGNIPAASLYLKNKAGWTDKQEINADVRLSVKEIEIVTPE